MDSHHSYSPSANTGTQVLDEEAEALFLPSFAQESLWFLDQLEPDSALFTTCIPLRLRGHLQFEALHQSLQAVVARQETLRTTFVTVEGRPMQAIAPKLEIALPLVDLSQLEEDRRTQQMQCLLADDGRLPFSLQQGPLVRAYLLRLTPTEHVLVVTSHHIINDHWSGAILWQEIGALYTAFTAGQPSPLPELPIQYADYAAWQRQRLQGKTLERQLAYWQKQLAGAPPVLDLPTDYPRAARASYQSAQHGLRLPATLSQAVRLLSQREGATLFMVLLTAFNILLMRYSGQEDIVVGTPIAGRTRVELEPLIGLFSNTLALRTDLSGNPTFRQILQRVREICLDAYEYQDLPFEKLVETLQPERSLSYAPLFQVFFILQNTPEEHLSMGGLEALLLPRQTATQFDLEMGFWEQGDRLYGDIQYNTDLFTEETIAQFARQYQTLLESIVADPDQPITRLALLTPMECTQLKERGNGPAVDYSMYRSAHHLFERQAERIPDAVALVWRDEQITFEELDRRANQLAHYLRQRGVAPEVPVGVCLERSPYLAIALLGILKAGGVYLPLDPTYPPERCAYMLSDANVSMLLTQQRLAEPFTALQLQVICLDNEQAALAQEAGDSPNVAVQPEHAAYIVYTSGSTGNPKGVVVPHRALTDRCPAVAARYGHGPQDRLLQFVSISFDVSLEELFPPWLSGAAVVLLPEEGIPSLREVSRLAEEQCLTVLDLPPSYWHEWVVELARTRRPIPSSLRLMIVGSETVSKVTLAHWQQLTGGQTAWCNVYGLSETTLIALTYGPENTEGWEKFISVPIGRPLANTEAYVLDAQFQLVPVGVPGELYLGGPALARGYLGRPDMTAERFVPNPFRQDGTRLYRTGDLVRYLPDGVLEFLGRVDTQVKVRGYRVELGEIEALLKKYPGVREAVVLAQRDQIHNDRSHNNGLEAAGAQTQSAARLIGYVVTTRRASALHDRLQRYLEAHLPPYMVPADLILLDSLPLTPGGKVDRRALAARQHSHATPVNDRIEFQTPVEELLARLWRTVLHQEQVGRSDDFFKLGGHSLQATQLVARIREEFGVELPVRAMYDTPNIAALSKQIEGLRRGTSATHLMAPIQPAAHAEELPLSFAQQRLWFLDQLEPASPLYNMAGALRLQGHLNVGALERGFNAVIQRHESLRTTFKLANGRPVQHIAPKLNLLVPLLDFSTLDDKEAREAAASQVLQEEMHYPFDLTHGPLIRAQLLRMGEEDHLLLLTLHHSVADGWSINLLFKELGLYYAAYQAGKPLSLPELTIQYADYAHWQRQWLQGATLDELIAYWRQQLANAPPVLELPTDYPRPAEVSHRGAQFTFMLPAKLSQELQALSLREGTTLFMTLLAAFKVLLSRYSGQSDILVGTPVAGRQRRETEDLIGLFINTLVLRTDLSGNPTFQHLLKRVREVCLGAYEHQDLPFEKLVEALQPERHLSASPLFQVLFALDRLPAEPTALPGVMLQPVERSIHTAKFDLSLMLTETPTALLGTIEYQTDLFTEETIARLSRHWQSLLESILANPELPIADLMMLTEAELQQTLALWNHAQTVFPHLRSLQEGFEEQAAARPDAVAVVYEGAQLTYGVLNERANQLAAYLQSLGVGPEVCVGLGLERSLELIIGILGILKAGGAYVPLDPSYPRERLRFILEDSAATVLLTQQHLLAQWPTRTPLSDEATSSQRAPLVVCLDADWQPLAQPGIVLGEHAVFPEQLAYVIYTSGSTGVPKGVQISHANVTRLFAATQPWFEFSHQDIWSLFHSYAFDFSVWEIWGALLYGGRLVVVPRTMSQAPDAFYSLLQKEQVTILNQTPSAFGQVMQVEQELEAAPRLAVRAVIFGGEALKIQSLQGWYERHPEGVPRLINMYGITETTVHVTYRPLSQEEVGSLEGSVIGGPIPDLRLYVLDRRMHMVPMGVPGELYVGGAGLARGYLNRAELTAERFVPDPFSNMPGERLYRTGDLVRVRGRGELEYLGRIDQQVKVRGYRIELGEIEAVLQRHPGVREAVVVVQEESRGAGAQAEEGAGYKRLVAYVIRSQEEVSGMSELRRFVKERLPDYMVPAVIVALNKLPLNPNGKVDRSALPAPEAVQLDEMEHYIAPRTPQEEMLAAIWAQVLRLERVGVHDNFFELGGDSILSMQIVTRARQAQMQITPKQIFQYQTIAELAAVADMASFTPIDSGPVVGTVALTPIQCWFFEQDLPALYHYNQARLLEGSPNLDAALLEEALTHMLRQHDALRLRFSRTEADWKQRNAGPDEKTARLFEQVDLSALPAEQQRQAVETTAAWFQTSLNLEHGPLLQAAFFHLGTDTPSRLLLIIHHLAVDGVSWRILLEDLETAYRQLARGEAVQLPAKTTSFQRWAEQLSAYAQSETLLRETSYWLDEARQHISPVPRDEDASPEANSEASARTITVSLNAAETQALLQEVPKAYHTQINDALLTALVEAFKDWTGAPTLLLDLEGHGREPIAEQIDLSRTVGWFTSVFPVLLDVEGKDDPGEALPAIKEQLRQIPQHGIGYGLLRYLRADRELSAELERLPQAEISFNYLGQFDQSDSETSLFRQARESSGPVSSLSGKRRHLLEVIGSVAGGQLHLTWIYSERVHQRATIERLAGRYLEALRELIAHCLSPVAGGHTPSDFPLAKLNAHTFSKLSSILDEEE